MDVPDAPNASSVLALAFASLTAIVVAWFEKRKAKKEPVPKSGGEAQVVAASFVERRQMDDLLATIRGVDGTMRVLTGHVEKLNERMHEDEIVRAAVAKIKEGRP